MVKGVPAIVRLNQVDGGAEPGMETDLESTVCTLQPLGQPCGAQAGHSCNSRERREDEPTCPLDVDIRESARRRVWWLETPRCRGGTAFLHPFSESVGGEWKPLAK